MFGHFASLQNLPKARIDPKDVPPPTPIVLPRYQPIAHEEVYGDSLKSLLQNVGRNSTGMGPVGFSAIGLDLTLDAGIQDIVPDLTYVPPYAQWDSLSGEAAGQENQASRRPLRNGNLSPGCQIYLERKRELSTSNEDAFRTVRRISAPKGKQQARLGNAYEFFRCLELFTTFWDDPTEGLDLPLSPELMASDAGAAPVDGNDQKNVDPATVTAADLEKPESSQRSASGNSMPGDYRQSLVSAFIKLVSYDFGCNVAAARVEPRLHMSSSKNSNVARKTHLPSGCTFIYQSPTTREAARAGIVHGPVAAVSARGGTDFTTPDVESAQSLDLAREIVAALITAQQRAREGKSEKRIGEGEWWTTKPRWGGGTGGPIGREIDKDSVAGDKDAPPTDENGLPTPVVKKARKTMSIYDNYRMIRPPSSTWDKKARYEGIGKVKGADYDDIFVISSLFHHVSFMRVRVPNRLLEVLQGDEEPASEKRSWGIVAAWRSRWFDFFSVDDRMEAMKTLWGVMAWQMRKDADDDVPMKDS